MTTPLEPEVRNDALLAAIQSAGLPADAPWSQVVNALGLVEDPQGEPAPTEPEGPAPEDTPLKDTATGPTGPTEPPPLERLRAAIHEAVDKIFG